MKEQVLKIPVAAEWLAVSVRSVWRLISKGELAVVTVGMRSTRVRAASIEAYIKRQERSQ